MAAGNFFGGGDESHILKRVGEDNGKTPKQRVTFAADVVDYKKPPMSNSRRASLTARSQMSSSIKTFRTHSSSRKIRRTRSSSRKVHNTEGSLSRESRMNVAIADVRSVGILSEPPGSRGLEGSNAMRNQHNVQSARIFANSSDDVSAARDSTQKSRSRAQNSSSVRAAARDFVASSNSRVSVGNLKAPGATSEDYKKKGIEGVDWLEH